MLASEVLRRIIASGSTLDAQALGSLGVVGDISGKGGTVCRSWMSAPIDFAGATGDFEVIPPIPFRLDAVWGTVEVLTKSGTISTNPAFSLGTEASTFANFITAGVKTGFTTASANTIPYYMFFTTNLVDLTANGLRLKLATAVTGVAPVLTTRVVLSGVLVPV